MEYSNSNEARSVIARNTSSSVSGSLGGLTHSLMTLGPFALILTFWNYLHGFFTRFSSLFIVSFDIRSSASEAMLFYLMDDFKQIKLGKRAFTGWESFVRPLNSYNLVLFEEAGTSLTFMKRYPIFISTNKDDNHRMTVSFFRGTYKTEELLDKALEFYDKYKKNKDDSSIRNKRFSVYKIFGRGGKRDQDETSEKIGPDTSSLTVKPLKWKRDELGAPISESPFSHLAYGPNVDKFIKEFDFWYTSEQWYKDKELDWYFGALFHGPPGTGKTSLVRAIAQKYDLPVYMLDLTTMTNEELVNAWRRASNNTPCVVLFEDMDRLFDKDKQFVPSTKSSFDHNPLTLDTLLNCINGVEKSNGIFTVVTANYVERIDDALGIPDKDGKSTRPGRLDTMLYFPIMDKEARFKIAKRILSDCPEFIEETVKVGMGDSGAQFSKRCADIAKREHWLKFKKT